MQRIFCWSFEWAAISDYSGNTKEIRECDFAGALRRRTNFNHLHEANSTYVTLHILDRVTDTFLHSAAGALVAKSQITYDDPAQSIYAATNAIRHDPAYGPSYQTRGLPSIIRRWYDLSRDLSVATTMKYDECGNVREIKDPRLNITYTEYWLSSADNAYGGGAQDAGVQDAASAIEHERKHVQDGMWALNDHFLKAVEESLKSKDECQLAAGAALAAGFDVFKAAMDRSQAKRKWGLNR